MTRENQKHLARLIEMKDRAAAKTAENIYQKCNVLAELWAKDYAALDAAINALRNEVLND